MPIVGGILCIGVGREDRINKRLLVIISLENIVAISEETLSFCPLNICFPDPKSTNSPRLTVSEFSFNDSDDCLRKARLWIIELFPLLLRPKIKVKRPNGITCLPEKALKFSRINRSSKTVPFPDNCQKAQNVAVTAYSNSGRA